MAEPLRHRLILCGLMLLAAVVFLTGIGWGLPTRGADRYLFGDQPAWSGKKILELAGGWNTDSEVGADVDLNPIDRRRPFVTLNATDAQRAEIIRRYRLFSAQPDEMITMRALAQMKPGEGRFDPKLYQYGGLWIYPVGVMLKVASIVKLVQLTPDLTFYLDHPEAFGRFYIVARLYSALWGLVGVWAVFWVVLRMTHDVVPPAVAALCYTFMPVVVNMAHEGKPHLPGAVLTLLAVMTATKYVESRNPRWGILAGAVCGAAMGIVVSGMLTFVILPVMVILAERRWSRRVTVLALSLLAGALVYAVTNPFVVIHLFHDRAVLRSNLGNSTAMYRAPASVDGIINAISLIGGGASPLLAIVGTAATLVALRRRAPVARLLAVAAVVVLIQFMLLATNKPGEYGRFAVLPDVALAIAAVVGVTIASRGVAKRNVALGALVISVMLWGLAYEWQFVRDSRDPQTRIIGAERLKTLAAGAEAIVVPAEPAPYDLPPMNLFGVELMLAPRGVFPPGNVSVSVTAVDEVPREIPQASQDRVEYLVRPPYVSTPITWAGKSFEVIRRASGTETPVGVAPRKRGG